MRVRIGIDVGGTFTDVVVIDSQTQELIGQLKLPTTHAARQGVAQGIVEALERAMAKFALRPEEVAFIAHSTTQATNALLEGDVAEVGVIGVGQGIERWLANRATSLPPIQLAEGKFLRARQAFITASDARFEADADQAIGALAGQGVKVIVASEAFGVDRTEREERIAEKARRRGLLATTGHDVSSLYGLRVRTRTAVINAAILPKMIETAEMTDDCVRSTGICAPLMIMRSDGGVMSVSEVHRRPILTMLSGPAAGIAGALMHECVSDGIFIEVGGTSADISVIRDGAPATRPARLNGHRMYLNTLDVRTLGVGGGSMIRAAREPGRIVDAGPRSAHIAGLGYACFTEIEELAGSEVEFISPTAGDAADHVVLKAPGGRRYAITTTCAANYLGYVEPDHFAYGKKESAGFAFDRLAGTLNLSPQETAVQILKIGCAKIAATIEELIAEYQLSRDMVLLVGGGGGAASLVPFLAKQMDLSFRIARNAEVISPIGVAMAMVRDTIERNIVDPSPEEILKIRREAREAAVAAGAVADSVEVQVEVDRRRNLVRATAVGTTELRKRGQESQSLSLPEWRAAAARSMRIAPEAVALVAETSHLLVFIGDETTTRWWGLRRERRQMMRILERTGVIRLQRGAARVCTTTLSQLKEELMRTVDALTDFGDAGRAIPDIFILYGPRIANFSGLADLAQVIALADVEFRSLDEGIRLVVIACPKQF
jgi:N-methylhydantoinase A/oxoprolinase/acetone carboxylase beta subunit